MKAAFSTSLVTEREGKTVGAKGPSQRELVRKRGKIREGSWQLNGDERVTALLIP